MPTSLPPSGKLRQPSASSALTPHHHHCPECPCQSPNIPPHHNCYHVIRCDPDRGIPVIAKQPSRLSAGGGLHQHPSLLKLTVNVNKTVFSSTHTTLPLLTLIEYVFYIFGYSLQISEITRSQTNDKLLYIGCGYTGHTAQ